LEVLHQKGGSARIRELEAGVASLLNIDPETLRTPYASGRRTQFQYVLAWVRTALRVSGQIENRGRGIWAITAKALPASSGPDIPAIDLGDQLDLPLPQAIPAADPTVIVFSANADGRLDIAPESITSDALLNDKDARADLADIMEQARALENHGSNRLGRLFEPLHRLCAFDDRSPVVRGFPFWIRMNALRIVLADHDQATSETGAARTSAVGDERRLEPLVASELRALVESLNVFAAIQPVLAELDARRPGPQEISSADESATALRPVVEGLAEAEIATPSAAQIVTESFGALLQSGDALARRQGRSFGFRTLRNFVGELLRRAWVPLRSLVKSEGRFAWVSYRSGFYQAAGALTLSELAGLTSVVRSIVEFVARFSNDLATYASSAFGSPVVADIINWIAKLVS